MQVSPSINPQKILQNGSKRILHGAQVYTVAALLFIISLLSSCSSTKKVIYFQDLPNDTTLTNLVSKNFDSKIQKGDLLSITVASLSPENTAIFNAPQNSVGTLTGYLVDETGSIQFAKLGNLQVAGLTRKELKAVVI